ncbi:hypothetical protein M378DRAFT_298424 [Amanita muscaria Koide BX008]|uniref:Nephrocystin 3-like N-terminal domain-containing protein n=1 Tax=Amanita muscaria (strain Koide BX008) TaxID=946122 RepID=A0A0C2TJQ7_AMAMK|nr:hypothetical protein M378DRAFT_298424 [Amanita muscaria Koide BX008]
MGNFNSRHMLHSSLKPQNRSTTMLSSDSSASIQQPLQSPQINDQNNNGLGSNNIDASGNYQSNITPPEDDEAQLDRPLDRYVSKDALLDSIHSPPVCHPRTRITVRNEIGKWMDESGFAKSSLLWLNGPAGVGKSVIAKTISGLHGQVVAAFFFSTSSDRSAAMLVPTLAWQLARNIPDTKKHIIASLKNSSSLLTSELGAQFDLLILQPLKKSTTTLKSRPVMVIDGVDECTDESMLARFLRVLVQAGERGDMPVRFIICSRPEPWIRAILGRVSDVNTTANEQLLERIPSFVRYSSRTELHLRGFTKFLQDVRELYRPIWLGVDKEAPSPSDALDKNYHRRVISRIQIGLSEESRKDVARYLTDKFYEIRHPGDGSSPSDISDLVEASRGQFLYAATIVKLLDEDGHHPRDVLEMIRGSSLPSPDLNKLYKAILRRAQDTIRNQAIEGGLDYQTEWRRMMDSLAILIFFAENVHFFVPKSFPVIESLLGLKRGKLTRNLRGMHSVLNIVPGESVRVHHRSFLDFLQSQERTGEYYISYSTAFRRVLILMGRTGLRGLRFNIFHGRLCIQDMTVAYHESFWYFFLIHTCHLLCLSLQYVG